jgi:outer membrane protein
MEHPGKEVMIRGIASAARPTRYLNRLARTDTAILLFASIRCFWGQSPPVSPRGLWHSSEEQRIATEARRFRSPVVRIDLERVYPLAELIDLAEANNPETRIAWEGAVAQTGALGVARSELFPVVVAAATAGVDRSKANLGARFYRETVPSFQIALELNYTLFDFGARRGRIDAESARLLALDSRFNDVHRQLIYNVSELIIVY